MRRLAAIAIAALAAVVPPAAADVPSEPFFPRSGSGAYDVSHYDARLAYRPSSGTLRATAVVEATALQGLRVFSMDLHGMTVHRVEVDGERAEFSRGRDKLRVRPATPLASGQAFEVTVAYRGVPRTYTDPDGSEEGWYRTDDGALAVGQPIGTMTWLPCNDTPTDKATFDLHLTVTSGLKAVANGRLLAVERSGAGDRTFHWRESQPMAPYLALVNIGRGRLVRATIAGKPSWTLVDPRMAPRSAAALAWLPEIVRFATRVFGPYPFDSLGSVVDRAGFGYALETQTRPAYAFVPDRTTVVHETAHQWFGNSVGLSRWPEIWLNEGFATWAQWYYAELHGGPTARQTFRRLYRTPASNAALWNPPPARPGMPANLFAPSTYVRGAMALEALRQTVGTRPFLRLLRRWAAEHRYGTATIRQFALLAEQVSDHPIGALLQRWLYQRGKPSGGGEAALPASRALAEPSPPVTAGNSPPFFAVTLSPRSLPRTERVPASLGLRSKVPTRDGLHPPALTEFAISLDRSLRLDVAGIPVCRGGGVAIGGLDPAARCPDAIVGRGNQAVEIQFPGQAPIDLRTRLWVVNGGVRGGVTTLFLYGHISIPTPADVVITLDVERARNGRYGWRATGTVPRIAGGSGSTTYLALKLGNRILSARCGDGKVRIGETLSFADGTTMTGATAAPCTSRDA